MNRIIFTVAIGKDKYREMAAGLARSLGLAGDRTTRVILTDLPGPWNGLYDLVLEPKGGHGALDKLRALELTDADQVIAIDCDSIVFRPLDDVFDACLGTKFAVQGDMQSKGMWHDVNVEQFCESRGVKSIPRFNGGFIYYERTPEARRLIDEARMAEQTYSENEFGWFRGNPSEEACVLLAMLETGIGEVLPDEMDFMSTAVGLIGALHMDVAKGKCEFLCRRSKVRYIRPYIFHAARYSNYFLYWRQLDLLKKLTSGDAKENVLVSSTRASLARLGLKSHRQS